MGFVSQNAASHAAENCGLSLGDGWGLGIVRARLLCNQRSVEFGELVKGI
jgi:hypothetical protein